MSYDARVLRVMVSSPSDVDAERGAVIAALHEWNATNAFGRGVILEPLHWEANAVPEAGASAQDVINGQLLAPADILIAIFGSRLGTPTGRSVSGTAEEIAEAEASGKPVHVYFSEAGHPAGVDVEQLQSLRDFRAEVEARALIGTFRDAEELSAKVTRALNHDVNRIVGTDVATASRRPSRRGEAALRVQPGEERVARETDSRGRIKYSHNRWVTIENLSDSDAEQVTIQPAEGDHFWVHSDEPTTIHAGTSRRFPVTFSMGTGSNPKLVVSWSVAGEEFSKVFHIG